jgi:hypothetical protein
MHEISHANLNPMRQLIFIRAHSIERLTPTRACGVQLAPEPRNIALQKTDRRLRQVRTPLTMERDHLTQLTLCIIRPLLPDVMFGAEQTKPHLKTRRQLIGLDTRKHVLCPWLLSGYDQLCQKELGLKSPHRRRLFSRASQELLAVFMEPEF